MINAIAPAAAEGPTPTRSISNDEATKEMFLRLLVAQIQNQDPFSPMDSSAFVGQLAQFSSMEQLIEMRKSLDQIHDLLQAQNAGPAAAPSGAAGAEGS